MHSIEDILIRNGIDEIEANIWAKFLNTVYDALRDAEKMLCSVEHWGQYRVKKGAFRKVGKGKKGHDLPRLPHEEGITDALGQCLHYIRKSAPADHPLRKLDIHFNEEGKLPSPSVIGKLARRTDIHAESYTDIKAPSIVFESKVVASEKDISKHYLGEGGLGCFIGPSQPYTTGPVGGLISYTVAETSDKWLSRIETQMGKPPPVTHAQFKSPIGIDNETMLWSNVDRPKTQISTPIAMGHIVMKFFTDPPNHS